MFNSGYIGASRSVRSQEAIESYEVPISMINKLLVTEFLKEIIKLYPETFTMEDVEYLKKVSVAKWKYIAQKTDASSWHHTGKYYTQTDHYSLCSIAEDIIEIKDTLDHDYKQYQESQKKEAKKFKYGVIKVQVWGGSRNYPKLEGYEEVAGIIIGDWLYYKNKDGLTNKFKTTANKVEWVKEYDSYTSLTKKHQEYKNTKKVFNKLISEKGC